jgi:hypothetical protein
LIATVREYLKALVRLKVAALVEREVMDGAARVMCADDSASPTVHDDLAL